MYTVVPSCDVYVVTTYSSVITFVLLLPCSTIWIINYNFGLATIVYCTACVAGLTIVGLIEGDNKSDN